MARDPSKISQSLKEYPRYVATSRFNQLLLGTANCCSGGPSLYLQFVGPKIKENDSKTNRGENNKKSSLEAENRTRKNPRTRVKSTPVSGRSKTRNLKKCKITTCQNRRPYQTEVVAKAGPTSNKSGLGNVKVDVSPKYVKDSK